MAEEALRFDPGSILPRFNPLQLHHPPFQPAQKRLKLTGWKSEKGGFGLAGNGDLVAERLGESSRLDKCCLIDRFNSLV